MRHVKTIWEKSVTQHSNACRSRDTLGQLPKTFWCGCWPQPTLPRATFVPGRRGTLPLGQLSMPSGDPGKWESATEQRRMVCYRAPPFPVVLPAPNSWGSRGTLFAEMWSRIVRGRGGGRTGSPGQLAKAGERARTSPGFESLSDAMVGCHEYISDPHDALSLPAPPRATQINIEREERTTLRLIPRVSLAACAIVMRLDLGGKWSRWAGRR